MKLIDVLVKELPALGGWPEMAQLVYQDYDRELRFGGGLRVNIFTEELSSNHRRKDKGATEIVTKEEYLAAVDSAGGEGAAEECPQTKELFHASYHYHYKAFGATGSLLVEGSNWLQLDYEENPAGKVRAKDVYVAAAENALEHSKQQNPDVVNVILVSINKL